MRIARGVRNGSPPNCCSSWAFLCRLGRLRGRGSAETCSRFGYARLALTRVWALGSQAGRVSPQDQQVTSFRTGSVSPPFRFSAASITSIGLSQTRRDFLRSTGQLATRFGSPATRYTGPRKSRRIRGHGRADAFCSWHAEGPVAAQLAGRTRCARQVGRWRRMRCVAEGHQRAATATQALYLLSGTLRASPSWESGSRVAADRQLTGARHCASSIPDRPEVYVVNFLAAPPSYASPRDCPPCGGVRNLVSEYGAGERKRLAR
jgi:hypothetical protein